jgi:hypothetical protein
MAAAPIDLATAHRPPPTAHRILARAAYGARPGEAEALAHTGLAAWLETANSPCPPRSRRPRPASTRC